ncbi:tyrosine-type recombinase/integrase [Clostridium boliviensis]|uniref:Tyrosine-type recombinase/integrase n=1 Tax=Clostridium boliviensis TaxID=318465 RepID=A0ABU4GPX0_9CLOT|nr:tyrosine-type recombinase/integrase [Clostridium boliviensis]MDW2799668.1 tyrosine-type recombinase/integrase [Clostridium boliviensis]
MDYYRNVTKVMGFLKEKHVCSSSCASHGECYKVFAEYLIINRVDYSDKTVNDWLASIKEDYSRQKCYYWSQYMIQMKEMISTGTISDRYLYLVQSSYDKVPDSLKLSLDAYLQSCIEDYTKRSWQLARIYCSEVMLFFHDHGATTICEFTYQDICLLYLTDLSCTPKTKSLILGHASRMMGFFSAQGWCPRGFPILLDSKIHPHVGVKERFSKKNQDSIECYREQSLDFPADELYDSIESFIEMLQMHGYIGTTLYMSRHILTSLYLFLEIHELGYLPKIAWIWFAEIRCTMGNSWKQWRRILKCYEEYTINGDILSDKKYRYEPDLLTSLPSWCRNPISAFLKRKKREFRSIATIEKSQYPCIRFCRFLVGHDISAFHELTPEIINKFSLSDPHDTFKGRSSYFTIIRQFLEYLEEAGSIKNKSLHKCLMTGSAPVEKFVDVLTELQINQIMKYRQKHDSPMELRNIAIVMLGLKMGLRASDVVNLKLCDIKWKQRQISIIQQKTQTQLTLPLPVDAGNSIYLYIRNGRPKSTDNHVFIRHKAPYGKITTKNCTKALHSILPERKEVKGGGFHVTRRTFATRLLRNQAGIATVIDSLGHRDNTSVMKYLSLDEETIRSCGLSLTETSLALEIGGLL